jgi:hypothetical protein
MYIGFSIHLDSLRADDEVSVESQERAQRVVGGGRMLDPNAGIDSLSADASNFDPVQADIVEAREGHKGGQWENFVLHFLGKFSLFSLELARYHGN